MGICLLSGGVIWRYGIEPYRKGTGTKKERWGREKRAGEKTEVRGDRERQQVKLRNYSRESIEGKF